jgi:hypothetical protein
MQYPNPIAGRSKGSIEPRFELYVKLKNWTLRCRPPYLPVQCQSRGGFTGILPPGYCIQTLLDELSAAVSPVDPH